MKRVILADMLTRLRELDLLAPGVTLDEATIAGIGRKLKDSRLMSITEYGRAVHAEMSAITEAARRGISVSGEHDCFARRSRVTIAPSTSSRQAYGK
jgi:deoxycytidylate deaminase